MKIGRIGRYALAMSLSAFVGVSAAQDAKTVLADASKAMGADTLNTVEYSATGFDFALGQAYNPSSPWPKFINKTYTRAIDFRMPASKVDRIRMQGENPPRGGGPAAGHRRAAAEPDDHRQREHAVGAAARNLDDAARLHPGGGGETTRPSSRRRSAASATTS